MLGLQEILQTNVIRNWLPGMLSFFRSKFKIEITTSVKNGSTDTAHCFHVAQWDVK